MAGRKSGERKKMMPRSMMDGLQFPVGCIGRYLKKGRYAQRIAFGAAVFFVAVLEYLIIDMVELEGNEAKDNKIRIVPHHLLLATRNDEELTKLLDEITIAHGGVIHFVLFSKKSNLH